MRISKNNSDQISKLTSGSMAVNKRPPWILFAGLLLLYAVATVATMLTSSSEAMFFISGQAIPLRTLTGAISSTANIYLIFLVVLYKKPGFIVSLIILVSQFPALLIMLIGRRIYTNIAGLFGNLLIIISIILLYFYNDRIFKYQRIMQEQATTDSVTKLPNRFFCMMRISELVKKNEPFVVAVMNINNFKSINNALGQATGDAVLAKLACKLKEAVRKDPSGKLDVLTYNGRDEFTLVLCGCQNDEEIVSELEYYKNVISEKITYDGCDYFLTARFGYAEYLKDADNADTLYAHALAAMTKAKDYAVKDQICRFTSDMYNYEREISMERKIRSALEERRLYFLLQPQYDINHKIRGFEALARIRDKDGSVISPLDFIPVAEKVDLIDRIDYTVFKESAVFIGDLMKKTGADITLSVNVSVKHLMKHDFLKGVLEILEVSGMPVNKLEIEITESIMIDSVDEAINSINEIKKLGIKVAIDDFGTGYSSLGYLNNFPADVLKIDKSFVDKMNSGSSHKQYVAAIISIGHIMNFDVIAEGVETEDQLETLRRIGCDYVQGYIWGKPLSTEEAEALVG